MGKSLTDPPTNLKEAVDWLALVGGGFGGSGTGKHSELETALKQLDGFDHTFTSNVFSVSLSGLIYALAKGLGYGFLGYQGSTSFGSNGIANSYYQSTYKDASWDGANNDHSIARIFLASSTAVFLALSFVYYQCKMQYGGWGTERLQGGIHSGLGPFMSSMGFQPSRELKNIGGDKIANLLDSEGSNHFEELKKAYKPNSHAYLYSYSDFLKDLERIGPTDGAWKHPLTNCYLLARLYCKHLKAQQDDGTLVTVQRMLQKLLESCGLSYGELKNEINRFMKEISTSPSHETLTAASQDSPSPAAPVAATLTTFGLGGGTAAAYLFNLGGTKTLVNGILRIG
ncbi:uncharacterized protein BcabD6B2_44430 [Babesia caballi]|uniref:Uncharacterized protein n=1 Tax=Babesia caballi TaxID=5871 RepID=A0AAV4LXV8_BABCB|nr:hypothetical protein, conserved [Babesia caballi]